MRRVLFTMIAIWMGACSIIAYSQQKDADTEKISAEQFVSLYVDLSLAAEKFLDDTLKLATVQDSIFAAYKTTRQKFDEFRSGMDEHPEKWAELWEKIVKELEKRDKEATKRNKKKTE